MPYIKAEEREEAANAPVTPGQLNFAITLRLIDAWQAKGAPLAISLMRGSIRQLFFFYWQRKIQNYTTINDIYGATACALLEFRRRAHPKSFGFERVAREMIARGLSAEVDAFYDDVAVPYEEGKIQENGDVY